MSGECGECFDTVLIWEFAFLQLGFGIWVLQPVLMRSRRQDLGLIFAYFLFNLGSVGIIREWICFLLFVRVLILLLIWFWFVWFYLILDALFFFFGYLGLLVAALPVISGCWTCTGIPIHSIGWPQVGSRLQMDNLDLFLERGFCFALWQRLLAVSLYSFTTITRACLAGSIDKWCCLWSVIWCRFIILFLCFIQEKVVDIYQGCTE